MPLVWNKSLQIGIDKIDQQHQQLINAINNLLLAIKAGEDARTLRKLLIDIASVTSSHFGYEEACMHRFQCPVAQKNKSLHAHFKKTIDEIQNELMTNGGSSLLYNRIDEELLNWFGNHIRGIDTQLKDYVH